ncbi:MAG TPA: EAL domain-containing protein [Symbiobacteriaceae bacterium]|nr:EAL domain-containing protein [Symbiobacteriaceae bacterium]
MAVSKWDVRTVCRLISLPPILLVFAMIFHNPGMENVWLILGVLCILTMAAIPDSPPLQVQMAPVILGAITLGFGMSGNYAMRTAYTLLMYLLSLLSGNLPGRTQAVAGSVIIAVASTVARHFALQGNGQQYELMTAASDIISFIMLTMLVYWMAEGQRQIRSLHRQLANQTRQTENELQRTLEASRDIVMVTGPDGAIISISPACHEILGYQPDEMIGRQPGEFLHPADHEAMDRQWAQMTTHLVRFENRYVRKDGKSVWLEWHARRDESEGVIRKVARDITERKRAAQRLLESEQRYKALFDCNPDVILAGSLTDGIIAANPAFEAVTGFVPAQITALERTERLNLVFAGQPADRERWLRCYAAAAEGQLQAAELTISHRSGRRVQVEATFIPMVVKGQIRGVFVVAKDITQRREAEVAQARLAAVLEATTDFVTQTLPDGKVLYLNSAARTVVGGADREPRSVTDLFTPKSLALIRQVGMPTALRSGSWSGEAVWRSGTGAEIPVSQVILAHKGADGEVEYLSTIARDIGERKRFEAKLAHLAAHDMLTGLLNRRGFQEALGTHLNGDSGALLYLDLDAFKYVNDSLGHRAGDDMLHNLAVILREQVRPGDLLARLSGDEFVVMLPNTDRQTARSVAEGMLELLRRQPISLAEQQVSITASVGIAFYPDHGTTMEELLAHADQAMYQAKEKGRNILAVYAQDAEYENRVESRMTWDRLIRQALEHDGLVLFAQPILSLATDQISHYELLLRMTDEQGGLVPPAMFLDVAERFGLIHQIDRWVVRQAIALLVRHEAEGRDLFLEVNLSAKALTDPELLSLIRRNLAETGIAPHRLVFEITETTAIADFEMATEFINVLKDLGCRFALDDFGAGFSSFDRLKRLPVDYLKLDGSFIKNLPFDGEDRHLVKAMVEVARSLGKQTIAEFVENAETLAILRHSGVDFAQGYHVGRPRPIAEIWPLQRCKKATAD